MAEKLENIKFCSPLKLRSELKVKKPKICHYSYNLQLLYFETKPDDYELIIKSFKKIL